MGWRAGVPHLRRRRAVLLAPAQLAGRLRCLCRLRLRATLRAAQSKAIRARLLEVGLAHGGHHLRELDGVALRLLRLLAEASHDALAQHCPAHRAFPLG